jgi:hypothetical protein
MSIVQVKSLADTDIDAAPIKRDLYWHDSEKKQILKFEGSRLEFEYKLDETLKPAKYRLLPKVVHASSTVTVKNKKSKEELIRWFRDYTNYNSTEAELLQETVNKKNDSISFEVPDEEVEEFCQNLDTNRFKYQVY